MRTGRWLPRDAIARAPVPKKVAATSSVVLALQRTVGNRATIGLLQRRTGKGYAGLKLGRNRGGSEVEIKRELGTRSS
jgi:hypothetical protein